MARHRIGCALIALVIATPMMALAAAVDLPNPSFEDEGEDDLPAGWSFYNWGGEGTDGEACRHSSDSHSGVASLRARSGDGVARPGVYTRVALEEGRYELRFLARAETGRTALVRAYLADQYSPPRTVSDQWTVVAYRHNVKSRRLNAEINVQHYGGAPGAVFIDDISLTRVAAAPPVVVPDRRPAGQQPRLLYFSGNVNHVADTADQWARRGFSGFLYSYLLNDWTTDIWAQDGKPETAGDDDQLLIEIRQAVGRARDAGLQDHVLKVALYTQLPDPFDDAAYERLTENLRQGARFARAAGMGMLAIDTEYVSEQYRYEWGGYSYQRYSREELARKLRERWHAVGATIARQAPEMQIGVLPEGVSYYGPLWMELFCGLLEGLRAEASHAKVHLFCEGTYSMVEPEEIMEHAASVRALMAAGLRDEARAQWDQCGRLALGAWPLGYYRAVRDGQGKFLGWSGRQETFGDKLVGSYADKSSRYSAEEFRTQLAALRTCSDDYVWIYGHGASWWQVTEEQAAAYGAKIQSFPRDNYLLPTTPGIEDYYAVAGERNVVRLEGEQE